MHSASLFDATGAVAFGGETIPGMSPVAQVYSGRQFGVWAGRLGDGRGDTLGGGQLGGWLDPRLASEGAGLTLFANGGWTRRPAFSSFEDTCQRSHAVSGYSHDARVIYRSQRYAGSARARETGAMLASGTKSYAFLVISNISITAVSRKSSATGLISLFRIIGRNVGMSRKNMLLWFERWRVPGRLIAGGRAWVFRTAL